MQNVTIRNRENYPISTLVSCNKDGTRDYVKIAGKGRLIASGVTKQELALMRVNPSITLTIE